MSVNCKIRWRLVALLELTGANKGSIEEELLHMFEDWKFSQILQSVLSFRKVIACLTFSQTHSTFPEECQQKC